MVRAAVVFFGERRAQQVKACAQGLQDGMLEQGAQVDLIDGLTAKDVKLSRYQYLAVVSSVQGFWKAPPPSALGHLLAASGSVSGRRCSAFVVQAIGSQKTLLNVMKAMEAEGLMIRYSAVLTTRELAKGEGARLRLEPPSTFS